MKIAFIRPSMFGETARGSMKPLIFSIIKPLTPDFAEITFYDEMIERLPEELDCDAVALTVDTFTAHRAYELARRYRSASCKIIMGGFHPSALPDESLRYADAVIIGEAEDTWGQVVNDLKSGTLKQTYISSNQSDLSKTSYDYSVFDGKKYHKVGIIQFSRGCKYHCDFCSINAFFKGSIRARPVEAVVADLKNMKEKYVFFIDDNLFADEQAAVRLFDAITPLGKKWACQISIDIAEDKNLLGKMKRSGCLMVVIGFESLDVKNLKIMGKSANIKNIDYDRVIKNIYDAGLMIYGTFVVGYSHDTAESAMELASFASRHKFAIANFNLLMAHPGTKLYERLDKADQLICRDWWINPDFRYGDALFKPDGMSEAELSGSCRQARYFFNSYLHIAKRLFHRTNLQNFSHVYLFLVANLVSRSQILNKQGRKLGGVNYEDHIDQTEHRPQRTLPVRR